MTRLRQADVQVAFTLVGDAFAAGSLNEFAACVLPQLRALVGADIASYAEAEPGSAPARWVFDPLGEPFPGAGETFSSCFPEHPFSTQLVDPAVRTLRLSDVISLTKLRRLSFYDRVFRPIGTDYQLATTMLVTSPRPLGIGLGFTRIGSDFGERERELLDLVNPHLTRAYLAVAERAALWTAGVALETALGAGGRAAAVVGPDGRILYATDEARRLLGEYFEPDERDALPALLGDWVADLRRQTGISPPSGVLSVERAESSLAVRLLPKTDGLPGDLLAFEETRDLLGEAKLRASGLTRREAEIVRLVAAGQTSAEIASALTISRRTVDKHIEHVLGKVGASNRAEAVAILTRGL